MPLRKRLILLSAAASAVAVLVATVGSYIAVRSELRAEVDRALAAQAGGIAMLSDPGKLLRLRRSDLPPGAEPPLPPGLSNVKVQRVFPDGTSQATPGETDRLPVAPVDLAIAESGTGESLRDSDVDGERYRVLTTPFPGNGALQIARSLSGVDDVLNGLRLVLSLVLAGTVILAAGLSWFFSRRVMAPIARLTRAAEHVSETKDLSRRIPPSGEDEVGRLASRFNQMLDTIEDSQDELTASVDAQRRLVADASHELRTPVASLRTDVESLLRHPEVQPAERESMLESADVRLAELTDLIADIIELARGEQQEGEVEEIRFDQLVAESVEWAGTVFSGREFEVDLEPTVIAGRRDRIARAVGNLLTNACKYSLDDQPIVVSLHSGVLTVRDFGPGIPEDEIPFVFNRFFRGRNTREYAGSGLGLAIVRQVAQSGGGEAWAEAHLDRGAAISFRPVPGRRKTGIADA